MTREELASLIAVRDELEQLLIERATERNQRREAAAEIERLRSVLEDLELHATRGIVPGWVGVPEVEWDAVMMSNAEIQRRGRADS